MPRLLTSRYLFKNQHGASMSNLLVGQWASGLSLVPAHTEGGCSEWGAEFSASWLEGNSLLTPP